jgi:hypothetical protein
MNLIKQLTAQQLRHAADIKEKIAFLEHQLAQLVDSSPRSEKFSPAKPVKPAKRQISAAGIARIRAAQKARWAKVKSATKPSISKAPPKKHTMSAEAQAKIAAAAKARWAKIKAARK